MIGDDIFAIKRREYLGEVRIRKGENIAIFPCEMFFRKTEIIDNDETNSDTENVVGSSNNNNVIKTNKRHEYWKYCFDYVTTNMKGSTNATTSFCMPGNMKGKILFLLKY